MKIRKIKILYIIPNLEIAGTEQHLINLVSNLTSDRFAVFICCIKKLGKLGEFFKSSGGNIVCLGRRSVYDPRIIIDIHRLIKKHRFDIVHTYLFGFDYLGVIPAKLCRVPIVISSRREVATWKRFHHHLLENFGNIFTDKVIACSEAVKKFSVQNENLYPGKITTIYNGINLNKFCPRPKNLQVLNEFGFNEGDNIIGMVTKFAKVKDIKTALMAVAKVKHVYPRIKCLIVGDGHLKEDMENKAKDLKINENIKFAGQRDDIPEILSILDIFLLTSLREGLPNTMLEAMSCGLPVVATNVGGVPEAVIDGVTGILVPPKNPEALAKAIINLLKNRQLADNMGQRGREIVRERFSLERMITDYNNLYKYLVK